MFIVEGFLMVFFVSYDIIYKDVIDWFRSEYLVKIRVIILF